MDKEIIDEFKEHSKKMKDLAFILQEKTVDREKLNSIFRHLHTLKSGVAALNMEKISNFIHKTEEMIDYIRNNGNEDSDASAIVYDAIIKITEITNSIEFEDDTKKISIDDIDNELTFLIKAKKIVTKIPLRMEENGSELYIKEEDSLYYRIEILFEENLDMKFIKCYMIEQNLSEIGNIIVSNIEELQSNELLDTYFITYQTFKRVSKEMIIEELNVGGIKNINVILSDSIINYYMNKYMDNEIYKIFYIGKDEVNQKIISEAGFEVISMSVNEICSTQKWTDFVIVIEDDLESDLWKNIMELRKNFPFAGMIGIAKDRNLEKVAVMRYFNFDGIYIKKIDKDFIKNDISKCIERTKRLKKH